MSKQPDMDVTFRSVVRSDVKRIKGWLRDEEVCEQWLGRYAYGDPAHLGYDPNILQNTSDEIWKTVFNNPAHFIRSIYDEKGNHIGEMHLAIEESYHDGQISILIGRKDLWGIGYGTKAMQCTLQIAFTEKNLFRVWVDVPEYNMLALKMCGHFGFVHEGTLRKSRPHHGSRFDSIVMGLLKNEYGG